MLCLINHARQQRRLRPLPAAEPLARAALLKAQAIARCDEFRHDPCGRPADLVARRVGYLTPGARFGENIAWGTALARSPRATLDGWLASPGHRRTLFRREWREQGVALLEAGAFQGHEHAAIWVSQFGARP